MRADCHPAADNLTACPHQTRCVRFCPKPPPARRTEPVHASTFQNPRPPRLPISVTRSFDIGALNAPATTSPLNIPSQLPFFDVPSGLAPGRTPLLLAATSGHWAALELARLRLIANAPAGMIESFEAWKTKRAVVMPSQGTML